MKVILTRHGQTEYNVQRIIQGATDTDLNEIGRAQGSKLSNHLLKEEIDTIYCSALKRTQQTIKEYLELTGKTAKKETALNERDFGIFDERPAAMYFAAVEKAASEGISPGEFRPPGGENWNDVTKRVKIFFERIQDQHKGQTVLITAHGGTNRAILKEVLNISVDEARKIEQDNCCINILHFEDTIKAEILNDTRHLS